MNLDTLYQEAIRLHRQGLLPEAIRSYSLVAGLTPEVAEVHYNLGLAYYENGQFGLAINACRQAAILCPADPDILYNLGLACKKDHRYVEAEVAYRQALTLAPADPDIRYNLGCCYRDAGELEQGRDIFAELAGLTPGHLPALNNLAYLHHLLGEYDAAREAYGEILRLDPDHASARYMHAVLVGTPVAVPPREYIRSLFDHYSATFEENLTRDLEYTLHLDMRVLFDAAPRNKRYLDHALDLGCGTGLAGGSFRSVCRLLSGVDLAAGMIERAGEKQIYDLLHHEEIITFLHHTSQLFDLFIATDVLIYLGDLRPLFAAAAGRATQDALFCVSTELAATSGWIIQTTGRYAHHPDYVRETAGEHGWLELRFSPAAIRREGDRRIKGNLFVFARAG
ncbi:MAG: class I SAM-dependent DNA methyltransferase [Desulfobulbaceae bacterium]